MKKICLYTILTVLVLSLIGCACGTQQPTGPENAAFNAVAEDAYTAEVLNYFQANTGYVPTITTLDDETIGLKLTELQAENAGATREDALKALTADVTVALVRSEAAIAELEALGWINDPASLKNLSFNYHAENAGLLGITILQAPEGTTVNSDALSALAAWLTGAEAAYLDAHPELLP